MHSVDLVVSPAGVIYPTTTGGVEPDRDIEGERHLVRAFYSAEEARDAFLTVQAAFLRLYDAGLVVPRDGGYVLTPPLATPAVH